MGDILLAIDQGTSSTRAIAFDKALRPVSSAAIPLATSHPRPAWVEQDPTEILDSVVETVGRVLDEIGGPERVAAAGLDNQGETVVAWDAEDGRPLAPAIVWQCRRSIEVVERLRGAGHEPAIHERSGLPLDPYFSAGKLTWLLEHDEAVQAAAKRGTLRFGTVDAWLTARLDRGDARTDTSTASRTQLFGLHSLEWDPDLLRWFGVEKSTLPRVVPTAGDLGEMAHPRWRGSIALRAMACDQQAALAGHGAFAAGAVKATYGTGVFVLANAGVLRDLPANLEASIAWTLPDGSTARMLQGGLFTAGAFIDWLRDDLGLIGDPAETADLAAQVPDTAGVRVLPALAGLGAPWWRPGARAVIAGLTAAAGKAHVARATLDGIAHSVADLLDEMLAHVPGPVVALRVDGGLTANEYLMQRQADLVGLPVHVASANESTALGIAGLAGIGMGLLTPADIAAANPVRAAFEPALPGGERAAEREAWRSFVAGAADI
jgi:glycerol kinase